MAASWVTDTSAGRWLAETIGDFAQNVGSVIPGRLEAYARIFHPLEDGPERRWSELAARHGRIAHAEMQYHLIACRPGEAPRAYEPLAGMRVGSLPRAELQALAGVLGTRTASSMACWFAVWEGYGQLHGSPAVGLLTRHGRGGDVPGLAPSHVLNGPKLELPGRAYLLLRGVLADVVSVFDMLRGQSPNLWWPDDRAWCVATEIDFGWTYLGGSRPLVDFALRTPELEALPADPCHGVTYDSDHVNAALDAI